MANPPRRGNAQPQSQARSGEVMDPGGPGSDLQPVDSLAVNLTRAEIDQQIATARRYPRQLTKVKENILNLSTLDPATAGEMIYARPQGDDVIRGPSIRFAELLFQAWGNARVGSRTVHEGKDYVEAEGIFHDLETNSAQVARVRRRIIGRNGNRYPPDLIIVTANAAASIARRNAILSGIPKPLWRQAIDEIEKINKGDAATLGQRRDTAMAYLKAKGIDPKRVFAALKVPGLPDITLDHLVVLQGLVQAAKDGEASLEELFPAPAPPAAEKPAAAGKAADEPAEGFNRDQVHSEIGDGGKKPAAPAKDADVIEGTAKVIEAKDEGAGEQGGDAAAASSAAGEGAAGDDDAGAAQGDHGDGAAEGGAAAETPAEGGEGAEVEEDEEEDEDDQEDGDGEFDEGAEADGPDAFAAGFYQVCAAADSWLTIKAEISKLSSSEGWNGADLATQNLIRSKVWGFVVTLKEEKRDPVDPASDATAFRCWIEHTTDPDAIVGTLRTLKRQPIWAKLKEAQQDSLAKAADTRIETITG